MVQNVKAVADKTQIDDKKRVVFVCFSIALFFLLPLDLILHRMQIQAGKRGSIVLQLATSLPQLTVFLSHVL